MTGQISPDHKKSQNGINSQSGNVFFIVMVAVALFAALMFTFSRGARQGGDNLSSKQAEVMAADVLDYVQRVERGVSRVYGRGFSENAISFQNEYISGYENANCTQTRCRVFHKEGGAVAFRPLEPRWTNSATYWNFTGNNPVIGIGTDCADSSCSELLMVLEDVPPTLCAALNKRLGIAAPIPTDDGIDLTEYDGAFAYNSTDDIGDEDAVLEEKRSACFEETGGNNFFYHVLLER